MQIMTEKPEFFERDGESGDAAGATPTPATDVDAQATELARKVDELEGRLLRARADFANYQRSAAAEREASVRYANVELIRSLLTVIDDFERCLNVEVVSEDALRLREGVKLVYDNMLKALRDRGVVVHDPLRQPFDPMYHEAIVSQPSGEYPPGTVITVAAKGYQLGDRVIRPARVVVASAPVQEG